jgi:glycosyltransferase involved in cell wall biosynthesis
VVTDNIVNKPLHIAMVTRLFSTSGGLELYTHKVIEELLLRGHKVSVVCESANSSYTHERLSVHTFASPPKSVSKGERLKYYYNATSRVVEQLCDIDLVHSQHLPVANADVVNFHNQSVEQLNRVGAGWEQAINKLKTQCVPAYRLRHQYDRLLCSQASCLVFSSIIGRDDFVATYESAIGSTPLVVAYPGSSLADKPISASGAQPGTFLFVGRGYRKKGLDILFAACQILAAQQIPFRLLIAGLRAKPIDKVRLNMLGLNNYVTYLGWQSDMSAVYSQARSLVMPSRLEPFGMAAVQAMNAGLIPIVSRVSGVSEIIEPNVNGFILENHLDANELAKHMTNLIQQSAATTDLLSRNAKQTAQIYTWEKTADSIINAYHLALKAKGRNISLQGAESVQ